MQYIFFDYTAVEEIISNRFFQSAEYDEALMLAKLLSGRSKEWTHKRISVAQTERGLFFLTEKSDKMRGVMFDMTRFDGFKEEDNSRLITIFIKTIRYAVRYFEGLPSIGNEKVLTENGNTTTIVYPFPFVAQKDSYKILVDRNSSKQDRKGKDFLTVYYYGNKGGNEKVSYTALNKMVEDASDVKYVPNSAAKDITNGPLVVTDLPALDLTIDSEIGFDNWMYYLTTNQKNFINRNLNGMERLEGAAGTGKTLTLILRAIRLLQNAVKTDNDLHLIFFTHSSSTKDRIESVFASNWKDFNSHRETDEGRARQSILVTTLQDWSIRHLGINRLSESEFLDKDASNSKFYQLMYIEEAVRKVKQANWNIFKNLCSTEVIEFIESAPIDYQVEILQREFSEIIKGQAESQLEKYLAIERPRYALTLKKEADRRYIFQIFDAYQESLLKVGQFDSDDIVLTALGQVNSPIWNRRRIAEGYDACFIDETHLFNLNEVSLFHHVNKPNKKNAIIYAIDRAQAVGDTYHSDMELKPEEKSDAIEYSKYETVFRSSPEVSNLAFSVLSSGANVFRNFQNPMQTSIFTFTAAEESKLRHPAYIQCVDDKTMFDKAYNWLAEYCKKTDTQRYKILFVPTTESLLRDFEKYSDRAHKSIVKLKSRADIGRVREARDANKYIVGGIDYIGGLEFDVVIILGADKGRIPPKASPGSAHVMKFAWYNRLYVAITRAKYAVTLLGDSSGFSPLLETSVENGTLTIE